MSAAMPLQHSVGYFPLKLRSAAVPVANIGSKIYWPVILLGLILGYMQLAQIGVLLFSFIVLFQLITLPVEFDASGRALRVLRMTASLPGMSLTGRSGCCCRGADPCGGAVLLRASASAADDADARRRQQKEIRKKTPCGLKTGCTAIILPGMEKRGHEDAARVSQGRRVSAATRRKGAPSTTRRWPGSWTAASRAWGTAARDSA